MIDFARLCAGLRERDSALRAGVDAAVQEFYHCLESPSPATAQVLAGWEEEFRALYGRAETSLASNRRLDGEALLTAYGVSPAAGETVAAGVQRLFFAIQTCFALLMKQVVWELLEGERPPADWDEVISGRFVRRHGVTNYDRADWYCWPAFELSRNLDGTLNGLARAVARYRAPMTPADFAAAYDCDSLKGLYEELIPRPLRHALGEYYTPGWLAELTLTEGVALHGGEIASVRILDPTCGSGAFLFQGIRQKRQAGCGLEEILSTVTGFDINPLAVLTAKTTCLLAMLDLLEQGAEAALPVYNVDVLALAEGQPGEGAPAPFAAGDMARAAAVERADLLAGNPPWVNWEYLPQRSRARTTPLWEKYGLFSLRGRARSCAKEDVSALITCAAADRLLKKGGVLAFVLRQAAFKSEQNGAGFRRFALREGLGLRVLRVDDLSGLRPFGNSAAGAAVLFARRGGPTEYPVDYRLWLRRGRLPAGVSLSGVLARTEVREQQAAPSAAGDPASVWVTAGREALRAMARVLGENRYQARTGVFTGGANGVYWLRVMGEKDGLLQVSNAAERARRRVEETRALLEPDYVFPLLRGSGVSRWRTEPEGCLLCPHTSQTRMRPVPGEVLAREAPRTWDYLCRFRPALDSRKGFAGWEQDIRRAEFHAILRVGEYTFAPYKVVWRYIAREFICAVAGEAETPFLGRKLCLPNEKLMYVGLDSEEEACYLCGLLTSTPVAACVKSYMNPTSISAHVLNKLKLPAYDSQNPAHRAIARLCREGHRGAAIAPLLTELDGLAAELYGLSPAELAALRED